jgi:hypothetical protein
MIKYDDIQPSESIYRGASLWHYATKFNVLLTTDMLNTLANGSKGAATYHAIYAGCEEKYGISEDDPNSLLEMLMNPETE